MVNLKNVIARDGYLVDAATGQKVVFYECDPLKNVDCAKVGCRLDGNEDDGGFGFCAKTADPRFRKDNGKAFYSVLKEDTYWGREYIEG